MNSTSVQTFAPAGKVRERSAQDAEQALLESSAEEARKTVKDLNDIEARKLDKDKITYGRTPDGKGASFSTRYICA